MKKLIILSLLLLFALGATAQVFPSKTYTGNIFHTPTSPTPLALSDAIMQPNADMPLRWRTLPAYRKLESHRDPDVGLWEVTFGMFFFWHVLPPSGRPH